MKTKIIAVIATTMSLFGCGVVWGQFFPHTGSSGGPGPWQKPSNNQYTDAFFNGLTNITQEEMTRIAVLRDEQNRGELRHLQASELPANYSQMTQEQRNIYVILHLEAVRLQPDDSTISYRANLKAALLRPKTIPTHPWRKINGKTVYVLSSDSGFMNCAGTVIQTIDGGVLVKPLLDITGDYFIKDFPFQVADGYELDAAQFMATKVGLKKLTTVLGEERTVTELDYGTPCERPEGGEKIEAEAQAPTPYEQQQIQENDSALAETLKAANAAKERVADFVSKISNDKTIAIEKQKQRQEAAKVAALKSNQDQAAKGDSYGLLRMGERYRDGDGVEKDLAKAKDCLTKAAAAGSPTAADELSKLNQTSSNSPATH